MSNSPFTGGYATWKSYWGELVIANTRISELEAELSTARAEERERCAKVAEEWRAPIKARPTIYELEAILKGEEQPISINPDGSIVATANSAQSVIAAAIRRLS